MTPMVRISFGPTEVICHAPEGAAPMAAEDARRWLDEQFTAYECEPRRPLGKVLVRDKLVALAESIGAKAFDADARLRGDFAQAATAVLGRAGVHVDVDAGVVSY